MEENNPEERHDLQNTPDGGGVTGSPIIKLVDRNDEP
jgi:hypothetical protein